MLRLTEIQCKFGLNWRWTLIYLQMTEHKHVEVAPLWWCTFFVCLLFVMVGHELPHWWKWKQVCIIRSSEQWVTGHCQVVEGKTVLVVNDILLVHSWHKCQQYQRNLMLMVILYFCKALHQFSSPHDNLSRWWGPIGWGWEKRKGKEKR